MLDQIDDLFPTPEHEFAHSAFGFQPFARETCWVVRTLLQKITIYHMVLRPPYKHCKLQQKP